MKFGYYHISRQIFIPILILWVYVGATARHYWVNFLRTIYLVRFSAIAQDTSQEKPKETPDEHPEQHPEKHPKKHPDDPKDQQAKPHPSIHSGEQKLEHHEYDPHQRFMSFNQKPAIFGSHAFNPITQEFEELSDHQPPSALHPQGENEHHNSKGETEHHNGKGETEQHNEKDETNQITSTAAEASSSTKDCKSTVAALRLGHYRTFKQITAGHGKDQPKSNKTGLGVFGNQTMQLFNVLNNSLKAPLSRFNDKLNKV